MFNSILIVCTGIICRSPMGERYLRKVLPGKIIDSAGTGALIDHSADETGKYVPSSNGVSLEGHKSKQITSSMGRQYDLILVMEKKHIEEIGHMAPEVRGKVMLFGHWLGQREIPDPYKKSQEAFELVYKLIEQAGNLWAEKLSN
ncbi:protein tyrosine phosphatase [Klebsiella pneumoniae]|uniref:arsenate reductase/protein-tyrosine-phosphatase family protein n=1 Tax=Klebsiella pneumoniae TaxID=573 RepID=UPI00283CDFB2|nr:protein tyrosine phosphatase [Klebsiella pneumoniae]MDR4565627.1 protein tyrosine phosphatase [Klebsiella pneumoniae]